MGEELPSRCTVATGRERPSVHGNRFGPPGVGAEAAGPGYSLSLRQCSSCDWFLRFRFRIRRWTSLRSPPSVGPRPTSSTNLVSAVSYTPIPACLGPVVLPRPAASVIPSGFLEPPPPRRQ